MKKVFLMMAVLGASQVFGYEITSVKAGGTDGAEIMFHSDQAPDKLPTPMVKDNEATFFLNGAELNSSFHGKIEMNAPHALVEHVQATSEKNGIRIRVAITGSVDGLKQRAKIVKDGNGFKIEVAPAGAPSAAAELFKEEQEPIKPKPKAVKAVPAEVPTDYTLILAVIFAGAAIGTFALYQTMRKRGGSKGTRRFLIEQLAYTSFGQRSGVGLLKIGREFVLVGVTPNQVTLLSQLPALQAQYDEESEFDKGAFRDMVGDEIDRLKKQAGV